MTFSLKRILLVFVTNQSRLMYSAAVMNLSLQTVLLSQELRTVLPVMWCLFNALLVEHVRGLVRHTAVLWIVKLGPVTVIQPVQCLVIVAMTPVECAHVSVCLCVCVFV